MRSGQAMATAAVTGAASWGWPSRRMARPGRAPGAPPRGRTSANTSTSGCSVRSSSRRWPPTKPWAPVTRTLTGASSALAVVAPVVLAVGGVRLLERPPPRLVLAIPRHRPRQAVRERNLRLPAHRAQLPAVQAVTAGGAPGGPRPLVEGLPPAARGTGAPGDV